MTCQEIIEFLMRYLDGELPADQAASFQEHLGDCPACVDYLKTYREAIRLGREACAGGADCSQVPEELIQAILAARRQGK